MTQPRPKISLFSKTSNIDPDLHRSQAAPQPPKVRPTRIPITTVSRRAIERLVESFNRTATQGISDGT